MQNDNKQIAAAKPPLKRVLADFGYSEDITEKIWRWYNPPELKGSKPK